jgi:hypothetical protein
VLANIPTTVCLVIIQLLLLLLLPHRRRLATAANINQEIQGSIVWSV